MASRALIGVLAVAVFAAACASHPTASSTQGDGNIPSGAPVPTSGEYPAGPFGYKVGDVFPRVQILGYHGGTGAWTTIDSKDYFDPSGTRGVNGVYITVSAPWCAGCKVEGQELPVLWNARYKARGARILTVLLQNAAYEPASQGTVDAWVTTYATPYDIAVGDPPTVLPPRPATGGIPLPYNYAIDPRTMKISAIDAGDYFHGDALPGLDVVLANNKK